MRKCTEYSERFIERYGAEVKNELITSITDMLSDEDEINEKFSISASELVTNITIDRDEELTELAESKGCIEPEVINSIEISIEWFEDDGLIYSKNVELDELNISQLFAIWNYLKK